MSHDHANHDERSDLGRLIDRLVDGELSDAERRSLLLRLDAWPDGSGWRRCALAFLEAQEWQGAAIAIARPQPGVGLTLVQAEPPITPNAGGVRTLSRGTRWLAMAAMLVASFLVGLASRRAGDRPVPIGPATTLNPNLVPVAAAKPAEPPSPVVDRVADDLLTADATDLGNPVAGPRTTYEPVVLPSSSAMVPMASGPWSWPGSSDVPALPESVVRDWRSRGYEVESRPRVISVGLDDGQEVPLPINDVRLRYVGDRTY